MNLFQSSSPAAHSFVIRKSGLARLPVSEYIMISSLVDGTIRFFLPPDCTEELYLLHQDSEYSPMLHNTIIRRDPSAYFNVALHAVHSKRCSQHLRNSLNVNFFGDSSLFSYELAKGHVFVAHFYSSF